MDDDNLKESGGSKVLTSEQLQKLQDLQRRRQQIQNDERKKKKKSKKNGQKKGSEEPESGSREQASAPTQNAPASAPTKGTGQRRRVDIENHSFTPSKERTIFLGSENPEANLQVRQKTEDITAHGGSHDEAAAQQALVVQEKGEGGGGSATSARRKRKKLYWGLDSKERWERKSNM